MTNSHRSPRPPPRGAGTIPPTLRHRSAVVLSAGEYDLSPTRVLAETIAGALRASFAVRSTRAEVQVLELHRLTVDLAQQVILGYSSLDLREAVAEVAAADALAVVAPQIGNCFTGNVDRFLAVLGNGSLSGTPVLLATTLRPPPPSAGAEPAIGGHLIRLGAVLVPAIVVADHGEHDTSADQMVRLIDRAATELIAAIFAPH